MMNKVLIIIGLAAFFTINTYAQWTARDVDFGANITWQLNNDYRESGIAYNVLNQNSVLRITPFVGKQIEQNWEVGGRGAFIWYRFRQESFINNLSNSVKEDKFSLGLGPYVRRYFRNSPQRLSIFVDANMVGLALIGEGEISRFGGSLDGGIGVVFKLNDRIGLESMVNIGVVNVNSTYSWRTVPRLYLGIRFLNPFIWKNY